MSEAKIADKAPNWVKEHMRRYLATDGKDGHMWDSSSIGGPGPVPCLLLTTKGRKSGDPTVLPLVYGEADGGYVIVASKGGAPVPPSWYKNLEADPGVEVQVAARKFRARATTVSGAQRQRLWGVMTRLYPPLDDYQKKAQREIPVVLLVPQEG